MDQATIDKWMKETRAKHKSKKDKKEPVKALPEVVKQASFKLAFEQAISGGKADEASPSDFNQSEIRKGVKVEQEHTNDKDMAKEIAMDHLEEFPHYYTELLKMEDNLKKEEKMNKEARCWDGYEPVPGKKAYSEDSCRKKKTGLDKKAEEDKPESKPLYKPTQSTRPGKKYQVYVKSESGTPRLIHFGATGYKHNYSAAAKSNFRARHNCSGASKDTPRWWACNYLWGTQQRVGTKTNKNLEKEASANFSLGLIKAAGGPGSGVAYPNTMSIDFLEPSPLMSIGKRRAFMENNEPMYKNLEIPYKSIKYRGQNNLVPKKLVEILLNADDALSKPVDVIKDENGDFHILDGHHRALAAIILKRNLLANVYSPEKEVTAGKKSDFLANLFDATKSVVNKQRESMWGFQPPVEDGKEREDLALNTIGRPEAFQ